MFIRVPIGKPIATFPAQTGILTPNCHPKTDYRGKTLQIRSIGNDPPACVRSSPICAASGHVNLDHIGASGRLSGARRSR